MEPGGISYGSSPRNQEESGLLLSEKKGGRKGLSNRIEMRKRKLVHLAFQVHHLSPRHRYLAAGEVKVYLNLAGNRDQQTQRRGSGSILKVTK